MGDTTAGILGVLAVLGILALIHVPLGDYMARVYSAPSHSRVERRLYRLAGVDPDNEQGPRMYAVSVLAFSLVGVLVVYAVLRLQSLLPYDRGLADVEPAVAFNTAISFVTNTNWQSYAGESTLGYASQAGALAVQNFVSAAVGLSVAVALLRGLSRAQSHTLGNFWVDLVRGTLRILLPLSAVVAVLFLLGGVIQNFDADLTVDTLTGGSQTIPGGPVASQEAIKQVGTNGGGFFNANASHPFENPTALTNLVSVTAMLIIPFSLPRTLGRMLGDRRQGWAILAAMSTIYLMVLAVATAAEVRGGGAATEAAGAATEGKETQFGIVSSVLYAVSTTGTSTGSINSQHDSMTPLGGGATLVHMLLGEVSPGGVGAGIYGILVVAVVAVFISGLLVGRTPEYLGKRIGRAQTTYAALYLLATPALVLIGTGSSLALDSTGDAVNNSGAHGFSEVFYAFASASNNNGSAFAGITVTSDWFQTTLGLAMLLGRFVPILLVLALAGSMARQRKTPETAGTLPTHTPLFVGLVVGVVLLVTGLTYFPALALGPLAETLS